MIDPTPTLYLIDADSPGAFKRREIHVVREGILMGTRRAAIFAIEPPIENKIGGSLDHALMVPRHRGVEIDDIARADISRAASVYVCRFKPGVDESASQFTKDDVSIVFWGAVSTDA